MEYGDFLEQMNEREVFVFLKILAQLAGSDGVLQQEEKEFIQMVAKTHGVQEQKVQDLLLPEDEAAVIAMASEIKDRKVALQIIKEMCLLAHSDDNLTEKETMFIGKVATAMGVELEKVAQISQWVIDRIIWLEEAKVIFEE